MRTKNELIELTITGMTAEGNGVGRYEGEAVFVPDTAVGDEIICKIVKPLKRYAFGIIDTLKTPSPDRIKPDCSVAKPCGGCLFRHLQYDAELKIKETIVRDAFTRLGGLSPDFLPILGCTDTDGYRNKAQYPIALQNGKAVCGFYARRSHRLIPYTDCNLQPPVFSEILSAALERINASNLPPYDETSHKGLLRHIYLRRGAHSGEIMLCFVMRKNSPLLRTIAEEMMRLFPDIKSVCVNLNPDKTNVILGKETLCIRGSETITDIMCGNRISLSPASFYQVNTLQAERLYQIAAEFAQLTGQETLLDLYCGAGTIGLSMAKRVKRLVGVEIIPQAVENAKQNAAANGIENAEFYCGDAGTIAEQLVEKGEAPDVIVVDPPRKGCDQATIAAVVKMSPRRVVMISCNPATAARDCALFDQLGYHTETVRAVDLFPRTGHTECIVKLTRSGSSQ